MIDANDKAVILAGKLLELGVSQVGITEILSQYPLEQIERQILFFPFRKAKRSGAFIVQAIRHDYSAPKEFFYASNDSAHPNGANALDQGAKPAHGQTHARSQRLGAPGASHFAQANSRMELEASPNDLALPDFDETNW